MNDSLIIPTDGNTTRCSECPGRPVLPTRCEIDVRRCVRCQGKRRWLPLPHPADHLCRWCRSECPGCGAPSPRGTDEPGALCLPCRGRCRLCSAQVPQRPEVEPTAIAPKTRRAGSQEQVQKRPRRLLPNPALAALCDVCREQEGRDSIHTVLRAIPEPVVRACRGELPAFLLEAIRSELAHRTAAQLAERVERRWWNYWSNQPLRQSLWVHAPGHSPDHVAFWLVSPTECVSRCEDGFLPHDMSVSCASCRPVPVRTPNPVKAAGDHSAACAASIRAQLQARPDRAPRPAAPATKTPDQVAAFDRAVEEARRRQETYARSWADVPGERADRQLDSVILQRRLESYDPVRAAALARIRAERHDGHP